MVRYSALLEEGTDNGGIECTSRIGKRHTRLSKALMVITDERPVQSLRVRKNIYSWLVF